ncbi:MAG: hypothetical protein IT222_12585 [Crocinitomix sp.]|nr:hypothetical protein [Crocinitomix sp.]
MKQLLFHITILCFSSTFAQTDSTRIELIDICPDLFLTAPRDSTYQNFYITEQQDTFYFANKWCVMLPQFSGITIWKTKSGNANGNYNWTFYWESVKHEISGTFKEGILVEGVSTEYYINGQIKCRGEYKNGRSCCIWTHYFEDGTVENKYQIVDGVGVQLEE